jgi:hypothetical protein
VPRKISWRSWVSRAGDWRFVLTLAVLALSVGAGCSRTAFLFSDNQDFDGDADGDADGDTDGDTDDQPVNYDWTAQLRLHLRVDSTHGIVYDEVSASSLMTDYANCGTDSVDKKEGNQSLDLYTPNSQHLYADDAVLPSGFPAKKVGGSVDFLLTFWAKLDNKATTQMAVSKYRGLAGDRGFACGYDQPRDRFFVWIRNAADTNTLDQTLTALSPSAGVWYHVGVWHSASLAKVGLRVWDDGAQQASSQSWDWSESMNVNDRPFSVGIQRLSDAAWTAPLDGHLDQILVYGAVAPLQTDIESKIDAVRQGGTP